MHISRTEAFSFALACKLLTTFEGTPLDMDMRSVLAEIAASLEGDITVEPDWLSGHVSVLAEDRVHLVPALWAQIAGLIERREALLADYQSFSGKLSTHELHPLHLLAYHGNWYVMAHDPGKARVGSYALSRFRRIEPQGKTFARPGDFDPSQWLRSHYVAPRSRPPTNHLQPAHDDAPPHPKPFCLQYH